MRSTKGSETFRWSSNALLEWLVLNQSTLQGMPADADVGESKFYAAADALGQGAILQIVLMVGPQSN